MINENSSKAGYSYIYLTKIYFSGGFFSNIPVHIEGLGCEKYSFYYLLTRFVLGRRKLIDQWVIYLPNFSENEKTAVFEVRPISSVADTPIAESVPDDESEFEELNQDPSAQMDPNLPYVFSVEYRKKQSIAIILLGIIGAEFGPETQMNLQRSPSSAAMRTAQETLSVTDPVIRSVAKALCYIVINPEERLQPFSSLRRSAVDLLGRGFSAWEPFLDVGQTLLALLRLTLEGERPAPGSVRFLFSAEKSSDEKKTKSQLKQYLNYIM